MTTDAPVLLDVSERIATITLNRPEARNALSSELLRRLREVLPRGRRRQRASTCSILTGADPAFCAGLDLKELGLDGREPQRQRCRRRPQLLGRTRPVPQAHQAADRGDQRRRRHRRVRAGPELRLPRRLRAGQVRRHPRPRRRDARLGAHRAAAAGDRCAPRPGDELHRQLHVGRGGAAVRPRQPRRGPRRSVAVHPLARRRHHRQRPGRRAPDPRDVRGDRPRRRRLGAGGARRACLAADHVQRREGGRTASGDPAPRPAQ